MKKLLALALASVMVLSLAACGSKDQPSGSQSSGSSSSGDKVVKIGVFEPATGDSASGGKKEMLGMQYANAQTPTVEVGGQTYQVELVYGDNGSDLHGEGRQDIQVHKLRLHRDEDRRDRRDGPQVGQRQDHDRADLHEGRREDDLLHELRLQGD